MNIYHTTNQHSTTQTIDQSTVVSLVKAYEEWKARAKLSEISLSKKLMKLKIMEYL